MKLLKIRVAMGEGVTGGEMNWVIKSDKHKIVILIACKYFLQTRNNVVIEAEMSLLIC